jgi:hypothetical protein
MIPIHYACLHSCLTHISEGYEYHGAGVSTDDIPPTTVVDWEFLAYKERPENQWNKPWNRFKRTLIETSGKHWTMERMLAASARGCKPRLRMRLYDFCLMSL